MRGNPPPLSVLGNAGVSGSRSHIRVTVQDIPCPKENTEKYTLVYLFSISNKCKQGTKVKRSQIPANMTSTAQIVVLKEAAIYARRADAEIRTGHQQHDYVSLLMRYLMWEQRIPLDQGASELSR